MYDWELTPQERIIRYRNEYRRFGLGIFESFEEYMENKEEDEE